RSVGSLASDLAGTFCWTSTNSPLSLSASSSASSRASSPSSLGSSVSTTLTPISLNMASTSSICSELTSSAGNTELISSRVGQPRVGLVLGHVTALLGGADELLDRGIGEIKPRPRRVRRLGRLFFRRFFLFFFLLRCLGLARHTSSPGAPRRGDADHHPPLPY